MVGDHQIVLQGVEFLPYRTSITLHFEKIVVEVRAAGHHMSSKNGGGYARAWKSKDCGYVEVNLTTF